MIDYPKQIAAFYDWLVTNPLPSGAIALWFALVHINEKAGWAKEFSVANLTLQSRTGLSRQQLDRMRNVLIQTGLIRYEKSGRVNQAGKYSIVYFVTQSNTQNDTQNDTHSNTQSNTQNDTQNDTRNGHRTSTLIDRQTDRQIDRQTDTRTRDDVNWIDLEKSWQEVFGFVMKPNHREMIASYMQDDGMSMSLLIEAIERTKQSKDRTMSYLWRILSNWAKDGIKNIRDLIEHEKKRESDKNLSVEKQNNGPYIPDSHASQLYLDQLRKLREQKRQRLREQGLA